MEILEELKVLDQPVDNPPQVRYKFKSLPGSSHSWALRHLLADITDKSMLDVGAGGGTIGRIVRSHKPQNMTAVEIDIRAHDTLRTTYDSVVTGLESLENSRFDWIVALDILEHLTNPEEYLKHLRKLLAPGGRILLSVPNVAHWSVRFPLFFFGSFEYRSIGIMDASHLYFFTRKRFQRLCASLEQIEITELSASIEPFELALPKWVGKNWVYRSLIPLRHTCARLFPGLLAYQHLALIKSTDTDEYQSELVEIRP